jgi:hypothetical protein
VATIRAHARPNTEFHAWAAHYRQSIEAVQTLAQESTETEETRRDLLRSLDPDPATIHQLTVRIRARRSTIERIIDTLPPLHGAAGIEG